MLGLALIYNKSWSKYIDGLLYPSSPASLKFKLLNNDPNLVHEFQIQFEELDEVLANCTDYSSRNFTELVAASKILKQQVLYPVCSHYRV
ncbi:MAG: hypothetical protein ACTSUE_03880, partial [Promethearchaeota archaeon]